MHSLNVPSSIEIIGAEIIIFLIKMCFSNKFLGINLISPNISIDSIPLNIFLPNDVTDFGISIFLSDMHLLKALSPIEVTDDGIVICSSDSHSLNAYFPIEATDVGIMICSIDEHSLKVSDSIEVSDEGIIICLSDILKL